MKVRITRPTRANGKSLAIGKVVDLDDKDAKTLLAMGKAELPSDKAGGKKGKDAETLTTENAGGLVGGGD